MKVMTKNEFMTQFASELQKREVSDAADIIEEYEQHFAFKLADGYSEKEVAARLPSGNCFPKAYGELPCLFTTLLSQR